MHMRGRIRGASRRICRAHLVPGVALQPKQWFDSDETYTSAAARSGRVGTESVKKYAACLLYETAKRTRDLPAPCPSPDGTVYRALCLKRVSISPRRSLPPKISATHSVPMRAPYKRSPAATPIDGFSPVRFARHVQTSGRPRCGARSTSTAPS